MNYLSSCYSGTRCVMLWQVWLVDLALAHASTTIFLNGVQSVGRKPIEQLAITDSLIHSLTNVTKIMSRYCDHKTLIESLQYLTLLAFYPRHSF